MKLLLIVPWILFISCSSTKQESEGSEFYSGRFLYTAGHDYDHPEFEPNKLHYLILHDFDTGASKRLTDGKHKDGNPIFLSDDEILFDSKRPCSGYAADDCPSKFFKISLNTGRTEELNLELAEALDSLKAQIADESIYNMPSLLENAEPQLTRPKLNKDGDLLAFTVSILANMYLAVYDLNTRTLINTEEIGFLGSNYYWSPNENKLARLGRFTESDRSVKMIDFSNNSSSVVQLPEGNLQFAGWSDDGSSFLLYESRRMRISDAYVFLIDEEVITNSKVEEGQEIENWFHFTKSEDFLVQKIDSENNLDIWLVDTEGNIVERITNNGYRKNVTDIQLSVQ